MNGLRLFGPVLEAVNRILVSTFLAMRKAALLCQALPTQGFCVAPSPKVGSYWVMEGNLLNHESK